jgi:hypothetical protein
LKLLTEALIKQIPVLYTTEEKEPKEIIAFVKFFVVFSNWTWYVCEYDGEDTFYGYVIGLEPEFGYFSLKELESLRFTLKSDGDNKLLPVLTNNQNGAPAVERDLFFKPTALKDIPEVAEHLHL